jgi:hypothetical protein
MANDPAARHTQPLSEFFGLQDFRRRKVEFRVHKVPLVKVCRAEAIVEAIQ